MANTIWDYVSSEASSSTTGGWNTAENQDPSTVNDGMRQHKQNVANYLKDQGGVATTAGTANAQTVTLASVYTAYATPQVFTVKIGSGLTNTSSTVTINVNSIGTKTVKVNYGGVLADPIPGDIQAGAYATFLYDGTYLVLLDPQQRAPYPSGHLYGLTLSNDAGDLTNDIGIAVGGCRDSTDAANIDLASALIKKLDASWAVGTNQGMLDGTESVAGTPDTSTWYHIWLIKRPDTGVVDVLASESATAPTMPTNYTLKRRLGAVYNDSSGNIRAFKQNGDRFDWAVPIPDVNGTSNPGITAVTQALTVPSGLVVEALCSTVLFDATPAVASSIIFTSLAQTDTASSPASMSFYLPASGAGVPNAASGPVRVMTNTSAQIRYRLETSTADHVLYIETYGYIDTRGRAA